MPDEWEGRPHQVAALRYTGSGAPEVIAAGRGHVAAAILTRARDAGVPVHRDPELASETGVRVDLPPETRTTPNR